MTEDRDADAFIAGLRARLDRLAAAGRRVAFWWRDDDAVAVTEPLERLLELAARHRVPLSLAVIPAGAEPALAGWLARHACAAATTVLQHGYAHTNHEPAGARAAELGAARPLATVLAELDTGRARLAALFGEQFLPVLTPPWNRIAPEVAGARATVGLIGLSTHGAVEVRDHRCDTHLDPIAWRSGRGFAGWGKMAAALDAAIAAREAGGDAPIGLLTHHLAHDPDGWRFVDAFLAATARHPAAEWPAAAAAFRLG